jgi:hypothetical protein
MVFLLGRVSRTSRKSTSTQHVFSLHWTTIQSVITNLTSLKVYLNICRKQMVSIHCQPVVTKVFSKNCFPITATNIINLSADWINKETITNLQESQMCYLRHCLRANCGTNAKPHTMWWMIHFCYVSWWKQAMSSPPCHHSTGHLFFLVTHSYLPISVCSHWSG